MLLLVLLMGSSIIFFLSEGASETYRCPYCAQIEVGPHHRLRCFLRKARQGNMPVPIEAHADAYLQVANQDTLSMRRSEAAPDGYKSRIASFLHGISGQRAAENGATRNLGGHLRVAP